MKKARDPCARLGGVASGFRRTGGFALSPAKTTGDFLDHRAPLYSEKGMVQLQA